MPIPASTYPSPRVLKTKETYTIPFNFVIPARLLDHACKCKTLSNELYDYHISLPPTMGSWEKNHMTPTVANVEYSIKATVCKTPPAGGRKIKIMEASQVIHVLPASREAPPMNVTQADKLYKMNTSASIRKNFLGSRLGHLEASGFQPTAVVIRPDGLGAVSSPTAHIKLTFEPKDSSSSDMALPTISKVTGKVHSYTYYSTGAIRTYPNMSSDWERQFTGERRSTYSTKVRLEPITLDDAALQWEQPNKTIARRDSGYSSDGNNNNDDDNDTTTSCGGGSTSGGSGTAPSNKNKTNSNPASSSSSPTSSSYTTTLKVPINLPTDTTLFIPTFHSCILSRVYSVELAITVAVGSASKKVKVNLPLQVVVGVAADGDQIGEGGLPSFETAVEEAAADAHLQPRVVQVPAEQFRETSSLPGYGQ
ncbi:hypothetical protein B0T17DRAFT_534472 [Bombardia bombarda]|uniref:Bul1 C-terminal domain-containing protein n=1 Tax=Bombardia bombarda TaxID=252184 RepID=A0AA40C250_9PEZI|nr:hypothetical protein B0T17DRAFT_534472 [Bombardia bombarda]